MRFVSRFMLSRVELKAGVFSFHGRVSGANAAHAITGTAGRQEQGGKPPNAPSRRLKSPNVVDISKTGPKTSFILGCFVVQNALA